MIVSLFTLGTAFGCQLAGFLGVSLKVFDFFVSEGSREEVKRRGRKRSREVERGPTFPPPPPPTLGPTVLAASPRSKNVRSGLERDAP